MDIDHLLDIFYAEAFERLEDLERGLVQLEADPRNAEILDEVFRAAHTLKGSSGMAGINAISKMAHIMEDLLDEVRDGSRPFTRDLSSLLLQATDILKEIVQTHAETRQEVLPEGFAATLKRLAVAAGGDWAAGDADYPNTTEDNRPQSVLYAIKLRFKPELFETGQDPLLLLLELADLGELVDVQCHTDGLPALSELDPTRLYLSWDVKFQTTATADTVNEVFAFVQYDGEIDIQPVSPWGGATESDAQVVDAAGDRSTPALETVPDPSVAVGAPEKGERTVTRSVAATSSIRTHTVRVRTEKLDRLVDLSSEVAIQLGQLEAALGSSATQDNAVRTALETLRRAVSGMQTESLSLRMVPVEENLARFTRLVRDAAVQSGKDVTLIVEGGETELDRTLLAELSDPIKHLLRNAVDHGVEPPEQRRRLGKPLPARVWLRAYERAGRLFLEIEDDGRGLDLDKIRERARDAGFDVGKDADVLEVLFEPGFSTADRVTNLSGRGVGLDVVKTTVERIGGHISVHSERGKGTRFRISLPLTLAVLDGLLVRFGSALCVVPLQAILETVAWKSLEMVQVSDRSLAYYRGHFVPIVWLHELPAFESLRVEKALAALLVQGDVHELFVPVTEIVGSQQVVVKSIEKNWKRVPGVTGATVLRDGSVALILDVSGIERLAIRGIPQALENHAAPWTAAN